MTQIAAIILFMFSLTNMTLLTAKSFELFFTAPGRGHIFGHFKSLSEKSELGGGEGFWLCARRPVPRIPKAGCKERANEAHGQKHRRRPVPIFQTDSKASFWWTA